MLSLSFRGTRNLIVLVNFIKSKIFTILIIRLILFVLLNVNILMLSKEKNLNESKLNTEENTEKKKKPSDFLGILNEKEAKKFEAHIKKIRW